MRKFCQPPRHLGEILLLIVLVAHVDLFEYQVVEKPTGKEHKMAKNGWKLSKVAITLLPGVSGRFWPKTGDSGYWPIRYGQQHSLPQLFSGTSVFGQKSTRYSRFWPLPISFPRLLWFGGCATHATPCSVPGYSFFRMCLDKYERNCLTSYLYKCSNPREFFFIRVFRACINDVPKIKIGK